MPFQNCEVDCGLVFYIEHLAVPVPLTNVHIKTKIVDFVSEVSIEQKYVNREKNPIEVIYMFPVEESAAVVNFEAEVDGRTIVTQVKAKEKARKEYDQAMEDSKTAVLLEETTPDIFRIKVGQLKPGAGASIKITYISELPVEDKSIRLSVPTTIAPRYVPPSDDSEAAKIIGAIPYSLDTPAPLTFSLELLSQSKVKSIKSPSHELETTIAAAANEKGQFVATCKLATTTSDLNKDLVVMIENADPHKPTVFVEMSDEAMLAGMVSLVPSFNLRDQKIELVFLVDRSGSMGGYYGSEGGTIEAAKKALGLFLHSLPSDCYFNIFSFGSHFDSLFEGSQKYDDATLTKAKSHVAMMEANYGGTEIYQPLEAIFKQPQEEGYLRQIFVLTDGEVSNAESIVQMVKKNCSSGRVFALGLGASASRHLVKGLARAGGGTALFSSENEDLRPKVMSQLKSAMQPAISEVEIIWEGITPDQLAKSKTEPELETTKTLLGYMKPKEKEAEEKSSTINLYGQAPEKIPPIYDGTRLLAYLLFPASVKEAPKSVTVSAKTPDGTLSINLPVDSVSMLEGVFVHQLAARKRIQDLEETIINPDDDSIKAEDLEKAITELGITYRLASKHTSFVGVDTKDPKEGEQAMVTRNIRNQIPSGFGLGYAFAPMGRSLCGGSFGSAAPMMAMCYAPPPPLHKCFGASIQSKGLFQNAPGCMPMADMVPQSFDLCSDISDISDMKECLNECENDADELVEDLCPKVVPEKAQDTLTELIELQTSDGHFKWGEVLVASTSGKSNAELLALKPDFADADMWLTAVCIVLLESRKEEEDLWELVVLKAKKFLAKKLDQDSLNKLMEAALNVIKSV